MHKTSQKRIHVHRMFIGIHSRLIGWYWFKFSKEGVLKQISCPSMNLHLAFLQRWRDCLTKNMTHFMLFLPSEGGQLDIGGDCVRNGKICFFSMIINRIWLWCVQFLSWFSSGVHPLSSSFLPHIKSLTMAQWVEIWFCFFVGFQVLSWVQGSWQPLWMPLWSAAP